MQPLNAARLFTHALTQNLEHDDHRQPVRRIDGALNATESLLSGLLDISRLDGGCLTPHIRRFPLGELFEQLASEFQVLAARNDKQARQACRQKQPDVVLLDYHLDGGENGLDLLQTLEINCPAILITTDHSPELRQRCEAAGVPLLNKPLRPLKLRAVLSQFRMLG